ncbi:MAG: ABC transporter ATP-binding protein [Candidatus Shapirobacteria bacterium]
MKQLPAIELIKVRKKFNDITVVSDLNLSVKAGEIYALIGPNGAGKTTTIKMVTTLIEPSSGEVLILGKNIANHPEIKGELGYIPDEPFVYPYLTGKEFLEFVGDVHGLSREESQKRIDSLLNKYHLTEVINGFFSDYSRGNKQKVTIIAALMHQPKVLVVDEPIVGLDVESQRITKKIFREFADNGGAVLLCTHTLTVAQDIADRIGILNQGKLVIEGKIKDLQHLIKKKNADLETIYLDILE